MCRGLYNALIASLALASTLFIGAGIAIGVAIAGNSNPFTSWVLTPAAGYTAFGLILATLATVTAALASLEAFYRCVNGGSGACSGEINTLRSVLGGIIATLGVQAIATAVASGLIAPFVALAPLTAILVALVFQAGLLGGLGWGLNALLQCHMANYGSAYGRVTAGGTGGSGGAGSGSGRVMPPIRSLTSVEAQAMLAYWERSEWVRRWPGATLDGGLGPETCPICHYAVASGGEIVEVGTNNVGVLTSVSVTGGRLFAFSSTGQAAPLTIEVKVMQRSLPLVSGLTTLGVITQNGTLKGVIAGWQDVPWTQLLSESLKAKRE